MNNWFTTDQIDKETYTISEYRHWEETHCYLLNGSEHSLLIDTGLGICNIHDKVIKLTDKPIIAVATHIHWDHIGGHKYFPDFYAHEDELNWLSGEFPLTMEQIKDTLFAYYPSTDPEAYLNSLERVSLLPVKQVFPAHHTLNIKPEILVRIRDAFRQLQAEGKLHHGSGTFDYGD
jgi:glyoxylase-like metal-dependent hydrolase (beta-lactamase superfamily II)